MATGSDDDNSPISAQDAKRLFADWKGVPAIVLAVSGGPDSIALMWLAARWRRTLARGPRLIAVTVDHGLRAEAAREAREVKRLARALDLPHRTMRWTGAKPRTGLPAAARSARYRLLAQAARSSGATHILTAHTRDDQAETLLMRLLRGSGIAGLAAMAPVIRARGRMAGASVSECFEIAARRDPQKGQDRFRRGSDQPRYSFYPAPDSRGHAGSRRRGRRCAQSGAAGVAAGPRQCRGGSPGRRRRALSRAAGIRRSGIRHSGSASVSFGTRSQSFDAKAFAAMPEEIRLRLLLRAIDRFGHEGPAELGKVETLLSALDRAGWRKMRGKPAKVETRSKQRLKQTLAGALVSLIDGRISVAPAPPRRRRPGLRPDSSL